MEPTSPTPSAAATAERTPRRLGDSLRALLGHAEYARLIEAGRQAPPDEVELVCPRCRGSGWLRLDLPAGAADFGKVVECACGLVVKRRADVLFGRSRIPAEYADLDLSTYPDRRIAADVLGWWSNLPSPWLVLAGDLGVGKTGLAIGVIKRALAEGKSAIFRPLVELLSDIRATYRTRDASTPDEADMVGSLKAVDVVAIDDLGAERATGWAQERLFEILNHRYNERRRTVLTTNLGPGELTEHLGERTVARITGMGWIYQITGPNLRLTR